MKYSLFFLILVISSRLLAQIESTKIIVGHSYQLTSEYLEDTVTLQVSVPQNYIAHKERYPVVYILDDQWFFFHGLSIRSDFTERNGPKVTPEFIIVGIETDHSKRWDWLVEKSDQFLAFIEKELFQFIDQNFKTSNEKIIFGWETTGGFVVKSIKQRPELFDAYIAASPTPLYGPYFLNLESEYLELENFLKNTKELDAYLFIGEGETDYPVQYGTMVLKSLLTKKIPDKFQWQHESMQGLSHQMCAYKTLQEGLRSYYRYYHFLTFNSKAEFERLGGLEYVNTFYQERAMKQQVVNDEEFKHATRRELTFIAISENDYDWFNSLYSEFEGYGLLEKSFAPHINNYLQFFLKHKNVEKALEIGSFLMTKYPDNAQVYNSYGDIYKELNRHKEAEKYYKKAVEIGSAHNDWRIAEYQKNLRELQGKHHQKTIQKSIID